MLNLTVAEHVHNIEFGASVAISNSLRLIGAIWLLIIGVGHYQARGELVPEDRGLTQRAWTQLATK